MDPLSRPVEKTRAAIDSEVVVVTLLTLFALLLRFRMLEQPVSHDEAFTYLHYVKDRFWDAISIYDYPNNHIFHTVCAWVTTRVFGLSVTSLRLPAFVCGVATVPLVYLLGRRVSDKTTGAIAAALSAGSYALAEQAVDARGYSVQTPMFIASLWLVAHLAERPTARVVGALALLSALGLFTVPTLVFGTGSVFIWGLWLVFEQPPPRKTRIVAVLAAAAIGAALTLLLYAPAIRFVMHHELPGQFQARVASSREGIGLFATQLFSHFADKMPSGWLVGVLVAVLLGILLDLRQRRLPLALLWLSWPVITVLVHGHLSGRHPFPRNLLFVIPLLFVLAARPIAALLALASSRAGRSHDILVALTVLAVLLVPAYDSHVHSRAVLRAEYGNPHFVFDKFVRDLKIGDCFAAPATMLRPILFYAAIDRMNFHVASKGYDLIVAQLRKNQKRPKKPLSGETRLFVLELEPGDRKHLNGPAARELEKGQYKLEVRWLSKPLGAARMTLLQAVAGGG